MKWAAICGNFKTIKSRNRLLAVALAPILLVAGLLTGWRASWHVILSPVDIRQVPPRLARGDAPETVRADVLWALRGFQDGYTRRDVNDIGTFMERLFPRGKDHLVLGTDAGEWVHGFDQIANFIRKDWQSWGDVRLDVEASMVSAAGDVAWLATHGSVKSRGSPRPIRFTAILVRDDQRWVFRQVQFQWENDEKDKDVPRLREFLEPRKLLRLRWR